VGFLANLLVLRTAVPTAGTFRDLVRATRLTVGEALAHQDVPCQMVGRVGAAARGRPEDVVFQMLAEPRFDRRGPGGLRIGQLPRPDGLAPRFGFEMVLSPVPGGGLEGTVLFAQDRFDRDWVHSALQRFRTVAAERAAAPDRRLAA
jgi:non-ribosomal peptide synthetase component F